MSYVAYFYCLVMSDQQCCCFF